MTFLFTLAMIVSLVAFVAAQGAAIFGTAYGLVRLAGRKWKISKRRAIVSSYVLWVSMTLAAYLALAGEMGVMDGFGAIMILCLTAGGSARCYLLYWSRNKACSVANASVG